MYRDLLVHVDGGEGGRHRIEFAVDLATRAGARLSGLHVTPTADTPLLYKPSQIEAALAHGSAELAGEARAARSAFEALAAARLSDTSWLERVGDVVEGVSARARYADLVILGQDEWQDPVERHPLPVAHSVVVRCGRPVLVVPPAARSADFARIAVAWDGSREAVRAVHDALPLLRSASSVHLLTIVTAPDANAAEDASNLIVHLANHGVAALSKVERASTAQEHKALHLSIEQGAYDLLIMGAYSHARWIEFILGGASQSTLLSSNIPVLVSH